MNNYKKAFTLAETLLTIGIIGVIAAIVIPTTISKVQRLRVETALPVAYRNIEQIITAAEQEEGPMEEWSTKIKDAHTYLDPSSSDVQKEREDLKAVVETYFVPHVQGTRYKYATAREYGYTDGIRVATGQPAFVTTQFPTMDLPNGMILLFNTLKYTSQKGDTTIYTPPLGYTIYVDINGLKKPNMIGKDIYAFAVYYGLETKLSMLGIVSINGISGNANNVVNAYRNGNYEYSFLDESVADNYCFRDVGMYCGAVIMRNSWKIPKNYPWL